MRTQVCIIGGGPSGLLLSLLLHRSGVTSVIIEQRSRDYVLSCIRAGVLEQGLCDLLRGAGVGVRMDAESFVHDGTVLVAHGHQVRIDFRRLTGKTVTIYGQTEMTRDLYDALEEAGGTVLHGVRDVVIRDARTDKPYVTFHHNGAERRTDCAHVVGCDGFHGVSRRTSPQNQAQGLPAYLPVRLAWHPVGDPADSS